MNKEKRLLNQLKELDDPLPGRILSQMFDIHDSNVRRLCRDGKLEHTIVTEVRGGMRYLVKPSAVTEYLQKRKGVAK